MFGMVQCVGGPGHDPDRYLGPWDREHAIPILVVGNRHDPAAPLRDAQAAVSRLGNARLLVVEGYGHTSLDVPSRCESAAMVLYLTALATPAPGTTCAADAAPFTP